MRQKPTEQLGFVATWSLAVGGMVGGGIYTALGVVVAVAVQWSWLSFLIAGGVALTAAYRYAFLANKFEQGGGAFEFLREIGQFVPNARVTVQIRLQSGDHDPLVLSDLTYKQVSDYHPLPAGRYTLKVQVGDQTLLQSTYGLAGSDRYTLTLYGILPDPIDPNPHTWMAQLKGVLGGVGAHAVNDYLPQMIVLHDRSSSQTDRPQVRLVHLAPGMVPLVLQLTESSNVLFSKTLAYPTPSAAESVDSRVTEVAIAIHGNTSAIASQAIDLEPRTLTDIFVVGGLTAPRSAEIVIAPPT